MRQLIGGVDPVDVLRGPLPVAVVVVVFSVIVGIWLDGVQRQSDERAELIAQLRASQAEVAQLSHDAGVAAERQRLAGDIHDTIAQGLSSIIMLIQAAEADPTRPPASTWASRWRPPGTISPRPARWSPRCRRPRWTAPRSRRH